MKKLFVVFLLLISLSVSASATCSLEKTSELKREFTDIKIQLSNDHELANQLGIHDGHLANVVSVICGEGDARLWKITVITSDNSLGTPLVIDGTTGKPTDKYCPEMFDWNRTQYKQYEIEEIECQEAHPDC